MFSYYSLHIFFLDRFPIQPFLMIYRSTCGLSSQHGRSGTRRACRVCAGARRPLPPCLLLRLQPQVCPPPPLGLEAGETGAWAKRPHRLGGRVNAGLGPRGHSGGGGLGGNPSEGSTPLLLAAGRPTIRQSTRGGQSSAGQTASIPLPQLWVPPLRHNRLPTPEGSFPTLHGPSQYTFPPHLQPLSRIFPAASSPSLGLAYQCSSKDAVTRTALTL